MDRSYTVLICLIVVAGIHFGAACNGYKARLVNWENCSGDDQVLKIDSNITLSLDKNCDLIIVGCAETIGFSSCTARYTILKERTRITSGTVDICAELNKDSRGVATALVSFGLPERCPISKMRKCTNGSQKISVAKQKAFLSLVKGNIDISIDATHDTGKSCLHAVVNISNK